MVDKPLKDFVYSYILISELNLSDESEFLKKNLILTGIFHFLEKKNSSKKVIEG